MVPLGFDTGYNGLPLNALALTVKFTTKSH